MLTMPHWLQISYCMVKSLFILSVISQAFMHYTSFFCKLLPKVARIFLAVYNSPSKERLPSFVIVFLRY